MCFLEKHLNIIFGSICSYTKEIYFLNIICLYARFILRHYTYKFGIISHKVKIGSGLYFGHFGGIIVHPRSIIEKINISQGVTIGEVKRGKKEHLLLVIMFISALALKLLKVVIMQQLANCVVTKDKDNGVVVGVPGKIISYRGSKGYISRTDYDKFLIKNNNSGIGI